MLTGENTLTFGADIDGFVASSSMVWALNVGEGEAMKA